MLLKNEITEKYIEYVDENKSIIEDFQTTLNTMKNEIEELSTGNRGIEEMEEEIESMEKLVDDIIEINEEYKRTIRSNEHNF